MNEKKLIFFPTEENGLVRQIVNGVVQSLNKKTYLKNSPEGHNQIVLLWEKDFERHGNGRGFSLPLGFPLEGREILLNDSYKFNVDRKLFLQIYKFVCEVTETHYKEYYKFFYKGEFDMSTLVDNREDRKAEITLMEGGNAKLMKAVEGVQKDYKFDDDFVYIHCTGIDLEQRANFQLIDGIEIEFVSYGSHFMCPFALISVDGQSTGMAWASQSLEEIPAGTSAFEDWIKTPNWFGQNAPQTTNPITVNIKGKIRYQCTKRVASTSSLKMNYYTSGQTTANQALYHLFTTPFVLGGVYEFDVDIDVPIQPGESIIFTGQYLFTGTNVAIEFLPSENFVVKFKNKYPDSYAKAYRPIDMYRKLCINAGVAENKIVSDLLSTCSYFLSSGDALRQIENAFIKTHYNDFHKAFNAYLCAGSSVEQQRVMFEARSRYYDTSEIYHLGKVVLKQTTIAEDQMYSSIKIGHNEQNIDDVNGKYDFNGYQIYKTPIKRIGDRQLDLQSPYSAGPYEIEKTRNNFEGKVTTDSSGDNKVYAIDCDLINTVSVVMATVDFVNNAGVYEIKVPLGIEFIKHQRIQIIGSALNDMTFRIKTVSEDLVEQTLIVEEPVSDESDVSVEITYVTGQVYEYDRSTVVTSGVPFPESIFNVRLHPYLLLQRHLEHINSFCDGFESEKLIFDSNNRNRDLVIDGQATNLDIPLNTTGKLFKPRNFLIYTRTNNDLPSIIENNPNIAFSFDYEDETGKNIYLIAIPKNIGIAISDLKPQEYELLSAPQNDLKTLIL